MTLPTIAITMGDPSGIGPEIIMKGLAHDEVHRLCRPLVVGDAARLRRAGEIVGSRLQVETIEDPKAALDSDAGTVRCVDLGLVPADHPFGKVSPQSGEAAYRYIERAVRLIEAGQAQAVCTAPISKEALHAAGHKYPGHTELLAALTGTPEVSMMLVAPKLRVIHVTTHIGLLDAIARIEAGLVERVIARGRATLVKAGIEDPRIGVCGINPHAGENGLFGHGEEEEKIVPAVSACRAKGWQVDGPLPADTLFFRAARGDFDLVVAMYHDQGHGPIKVMGLEAGVNVTVGLPVVRTSVDHGTAFDIAGKGIADERSLIEAPAPGRGPGVARLNGGRRPVTCANTTLPRSQAEVVLEMPPAGRAAEEDTGERGQDARGRRCPRPDGGALGGADRRRGADHPPCGRQPPHSCPSWPRLIQISAASPTDSSAPGRAGSASAATARPAPARVRSSAGWQGAWGSRSSTSAPHLFSMWVER